MVIGHIPLCGDQDDQKEWHWMKAVQESKHCGETVEFKLDELKAFLLNTDIIMRNSFTVPCDFWVIKALVRNQQVCPAAVKSLTLCNSKRANKEKGDTARRACDSEQGIHSSDLSDAVLTTFLAKRQSVLSTNWACVSGGEIKRLQLPTETSSPGPAVQHKSKAAARWRLGAAQSLSSHHYLFGKHVLTYQIRFNSLLMVLGVATDPTACGEASSLMGQTMFQLHTLSMGFTSTDACNLPEPRVLHTWTCCHTVMQAPLL